MQTIRELYSTSVSKLPINERLQLVTLILNELAPLDAISKPRQSIRQMLKEMPAGRLFKTSGEADEYLEEERDSWDR